MLADPGVSREECLEGLQEDHFLHNFHSTWNSTSRPGDILVLIKAFLCPEQIIGKLIPERKYPSLPVAQLVKGNLPAMQETRVPSLGWEIPWRRAWLPTPVCLPGDSHGQRSLAGCSPRGHNWSDMTERLTLSPILCCSVAQSFHSVHGLQHVRLLCPSPTPELAHTHVR